ncbi:MAG: ankyrin repeat domain-containing protein [Rickettsiaceae bacterium]|nr:ankyrin repeat domain-containing protein [Rickettsiaceae bacterium]
MSKIDRAYQPGDSPFIKAIKEERIEGIKKMLQQGASANFPTFSKVTPLMVAIVVGNVEIASLLLEHGANPNECNDYGDTPLIIAAQEHNIEMLELLLQNKRTDVNQASRVDKETALALAVEKRDIDVVKMLLLYDADVNQAMDNGDTPFILAVKAGDVPFVEEMISRADLSKSFFLSEDLPNVTAAEIATLKGSSAIIDILQYEDNQDDLELSGLS